MAHARSGTDEHGTNQHGTSERSTNESSTAVTGTDENRTDGNGTADGVGTPALTAADVLDCADEPIRIPGSVQPHGALLAVDPSDHRVVIASRSVEAHLGWSAEELIGRDVTELLGPEVLSELPGDHDAPEPRTLEPLTRSGARSTFDALVHRADGLLVVELEPRGEDPAAATRRTRIALRALQVAGTRDELTRRLADEVRAVTGFDRVMVYRFDEQWNGEVVAEAAAEHLEPLLGLHFPASDIPAQARALYTAQWLRSIPDARYTPSPLVPAENPLTGAPLDLSGAALRSVSPVHLQYLANMGVRASMSVSLVVHGRLWGLVACHHYSGPHFPSPAVRTSAEFFGRTASLLLQGMHDEARYVDGMALAAGLADLTRSLHADSRDPVAALTGEDGVLDVMEGSAGAAVRIDGRMRLVGRTPTASQVDAVLDALWRGTRRTVATRSLTTALAEVPGGPELAAEVVDVASGVLAVPLGSGGRDVLVWFRPEVLREVRWAGDPDAKELVATPAGLALTPRASFAAWVETVRGTSLAWPDAQVGAAETLARDLDEVVLRRKADDERVAAALQRIVLTERPVLPAGYAMSQRFQPSGADVLGGDWYDVTTLPSGRTVVMVGDVAGHGIGVAAITAQVRHALRAYLVDHESAAEALARINELIATLLPGELATVAAAELDPATGEVTVSLAGHLPPLHVTADGATFVRGASGPALGIVRRTGTPYATATVRLEPGESLVLYSDGLVEDRATPLRTALDNLRDLAVATGPDREALCDAMVGAAPSTEDDTTVVVIGRTAA